MPDLTVAYRTLYFTQNAPFYKGIPLTDLDTMLGADMTGWAVKCQVRDSYGGTLLAEFHSDRVGHSGWPGVITFETTAQGSNLIMTLAAQYTAAMPAVSGAVFDIVAKAPGATGYYPIVKGYAHVLPEVSTDG